MQPTGYFSLCFLTKSAKHDLMHIPAFLIRATNTTGPIVKAFVSCTIFPDVPSGQFLMVLEQAIASSVSK